MKDFIDDDKMKKQNSQQYNLAANFKSTITTTTTSRNYMHIKKPKTKQNETWTFDLCVWWWLIFDDQDDADDDDDDKNITKKKKI